MEIHAPEGSVHSFRDVAIHLAIVTVGILIALGLEQAVEWYHHRELAAEARANILSEIGDNRKELDSLLGKVPDSRGNHLSAVRVIDTYLAHGTSADNKMNLGVGIAEIRDTAWTTAQTIGALNYMPYGEVQKFASAYRLQQQFQRLQDRAVDAVVTSVAVFAEGQGPDKLSQTDLVLERQRILDSLAQIVAETQLAEGLDKTYAEVLGTGKKAE
jgi:hypothetical protein